MATSRSNEVLGDVSGRRFRNESDSTLFSDCKRGDEYDRWRTEGLSEALGPDVSSGTRFRGNILKEASPVRVGLAPEGSGGNFIESCLMALNESSETEEFVRLRPLAEEVVVSWEFEWTRFGGSAKGLYSVGTDLVLALRLRPRVPLLAVLLIGNSSFGLLSWVDKGGETD